jgi:integrase
MTDTSPTTVNRTLRRLPNQAYEKEVDRLIEAARKRGRNGQRDATAILLGYRDGLRAAELCSLRWSQIDLRHGRLHVNRAKGGIESVHPLHGPELRALRPLQGSSPYVFITESGTPVTTAWFLRMVQRTGLAAKLPFQVHPHMLRHSTGYKLANDGQDTRSLAHYLGHRNLQSTARYTRLPLIGCEVLEGLAVCESPWRRIAGITPGALGCRSGFRPRSPLRLLENTPNVRR